MKAFVKGFSFALLLVGSTAMATPYESLFNAYEHGQIPPRDGLLENVILVGHCHAQSGAEAAAVMRYHEMSEPIVGTRAFVETLIHEQDVDYFEKATFEKISEDFESVYAIPSSVVTPVVAPNPSTWEFASGDSKYHYSMRYAADANDGRASYLIHSTGPAGAKMCSYYKPRLNK